jgi:hypothetical protein
MNPYVTERVAAEYDRDRHAAAARDRRAGAARREGTARSTGTERSAGTERNAGTARGAGGRLRDGRSLAIRIARLVRRSA